MVTVNQSTRIYCFTLFIVLAICGIVGVNGDVNILCGEWTRWTPCEDGKQYRGRWCRYRRGSEPRKSRAALPRSIQEWIGRVESHGAPKSDATYVVEADFEISRCGQSNNLWVPPGRARVRADERDFRKHQGIGTKTRNEEKDQNRPSGLGLKTQREVERERKKAEREQRKAEREQRKAEREQRKAEREKKKAEREERRAERERKRAERGKKGPKIARENCPLDPAKGGETPIIGQGGSEPIIASAKNGPSNNSQDTKTPSFKAQETFNDTREPVRPQLVVPRPLVTPKRVQEPIRVVTPTVPRAAPVVVTQPRKPKPPRRPLRPWRPTRPGGRRPNVTPRIKRPATPRPAPNTRRIRVVPIKVPRVVAQPRIVTPIVRPSAVTKPAEPKVNATNETGILAHVYPVPPVPSDAPVTKEPEPSNVKEGQDDKSPNEQGNSQSSDNGEYRDVPRGMKEDEELTNQNDRLNEEAAPILENGNDKERVKASSTTSEENEKPSYGGDLSSLEREAAEPSIGIVHPLESDTANGNEDDGISPLISEGENGARDDKGAIPPQPPVTPPTEGSSETPQSVGKVGALDIANPDETRVDINKGDSSGVGYRGLMPKDDVIVSSVLDAGATVWEAEGANDKCVAINLYSRGDTSLLTLWTIRGESLDILYFKRVKDKWDGITPKEFKEKLNGMDDGDEDNDKRDEPAVQEPAKDTFEGTRDSTPSKAAEEENKTPVVVLPDKESKNAQDQADGPTIKEPEEAIVSEDGKLAPEPMAHKDEDQVSLSRDEDVQNDDSGVPEPTMHAPEIQEVKDLESPVNETSEADPVENVNTEDDVQSPEQASREEEVLEHKQGKEGESIFSSGDVPPKDDAPKGPLGMDNLDLAGEGGKEGDDDDDDKGPEMVADDQPKDGDAHDPLKAVEPLEGEDEQEAGQEKEGGDQEGVQGPEEVLPEPQAVDPPEESNEERPESEMPEVVLPPAEPNDNDEKEPETIPDAPAKKDDSGESQPEEALAQEHGTPKENEVEGEEQDGNRAQDEQPPDEEGSEVKEEDSPVEDPKPVSNEEESSNEQEELGDLDDQDSEETLVEEVQPEVVPPAESPEDDEPGKESESDDMGDPSKENEQEARVEETGSEGVTSEDDGLESNKGETPKGDEEQKASESASNTEEVVQEQPEPEPATEEEEQSPGNSEASQEGNDESNEHSPSLGDNDDEDEEEEDDDEEAGQEEEGELQDADKEDEEPSTNDDSEENESEFNEPREGAESPEDDEPEPSDPAEDAETPENEVSTDAQDDGDKGDDEEPEYDEVEEEGAKEPEAPVETTTDADGSKVLEDAPVKKEESRDKPSSDDKEHETAQIDDPDHAGRVEYAAILGDYDQNLAPETKQRGFGTGAKIAGGIIGGLLAIAAAGAGYKLHKKRFVCVVHGLEVPRREYGPCSRYLSSLHTILGTPGSPEIF
ncbi:hypothetical protein BEWA_001550 [Theileria equi strain WA]|uniref:IgA-specific serine endopeptidase n=1 Tax=Theileria equi strain WA TaxID=1537102 RepID=L0AZR4_THEEQ|nr:hypothetical protein BEWA_001550 [Theileria equi strain WA]AFZ80748.1 hypothetical protein BEWA_001550 [Theileria equi strain WA]|eukprot:XP_004830414.1 hypothetical protein BEWA_001550 [Theileria equi strain WA]